MLGAVHDAHPKPLTCVPLGHKTQVQSENVNGEDALQYCGRGQARHAVWEGFGRDPDGQELQLAMVDDRKRGRVHDVQLAPPAKLCDPSPHAVQLAMVTERYW